MRAGEPTVEIVDQRSSTLHFPAAIWLAAAAVIALWVELITQLHLDWSYNPSYGYGWSVPFLAGYLFVRRWSSRPEPHPFASSRWPALLTIVFAAMEHGNLDNSHYLCRASSHRRSTLGKAFRLSSSVPYGQRPMADATRTNRRAAIDANGGRD